MKNKIEITKENLEESCEGNIFSRMLLLNTFMK